MGRYSTYIIFNDLECIFAQLGIKINSTLSEDRAFIKKHFGGNNNEK